jgi:Inner membrane component domain
MSIISLLLNLLWIVFGGLWMALGWVVAAAVMAITIVGLPWARAAFNIAAYTLLPFGYKAVPRDEYLGREDVGTGPLGGDRQHCVVAARRMVVGTRSPGHGDPACCDHRWHPIRLGAPEASH